MYESMINRETVRSEMEYRLSRIRTELGNRRVRRGQERRQTGEFVRVDR
jgi:hypothetical protein